MEKRLTKRLVVALTLSTSIIIAPPIMENVEANPLKKFGKVLKKADKNVRKGVKNFTKSPVAPLIGGLIAGTIAAEIFDNGVAGVIVGVGVGAFINNEMRKNLNEPQQRQMTKSTVSAVATGQNQTWSSDSGASGSVKVVSTEEKPEPVTISVDKKKVAEVPPLDFIGEAYELTSNSNIRGGPDTSYEKVGHLRAGSKVNVVGKVKDEPWYFISQNGVGSGFLFAELAKPSSASLIDEIPKPSPEQEVFEEEVAETKLCRVIEQSVTLADGSTKAEKITACKGANGWEMQKAQT